MVKPFFLAMFCFFSLNVSAAEYMIIDEHTPLPEGAKEVYQAPAVLTWKALRSDKTLYGTLRRWASMADWQVEWELESEVPIAAEAEVVGTWEDAVKAFADAMAEAREPVTPVMYEGNHVLRVIHKGMQ